eukprot:2355926-Pleurochrysis_carterae.AAC.1
MIAETKRERRHCCPCDSTFHACPSQTGLYKSRSCDENAGPRRTSSPTSNGAPVHRGCCTVVEIGT